MSVDSDEVKKIAHLARIAIDDSTIPQYQNDLNNILNLVEQMSQANTDNIAPMANPLDAKQRLRQDKVTESNQREAFQAIAPATQDGLYLVPQVIESAQQGK